MARRQIYEAPRATRSPESARRPRRHRAMVEAGRRDRPMAAQDMPDSTPRRPKVVIESVPENSAVVAKQERRANRRLRPDPPPGLRRTGHRHDDEGRGAGRHGEAEELHLLRVGVAPRGAGAAGPRRPRVQHVRGVLPHRARRVPHRAITHRQGRDTRARRSAGVVSTRDITEARPGHQAEPSPSRRGGGTDRRWRGPRGRHPRGGGRCPAGRPSMADASVADSIAPPPGRGTRRTSLCAIRGDPDERATTATGRPDGPPTTAATGQAQQSGGTGHDLAAETERTRRLGGHSARPQLTDAGREPDAEPPIIDRPSESGGRRAAPPPEAKPTEPRHRTRTTLNPAGKRSRARGPGRRVTRTEALTQLASDHDEEHDDDFVPHNWPTSRRTFSASGRFLEGRERVLGRGGRSWLAGRRSAPRRRRQPPSPPRRVKRQAGGAHSGTRRLLAAESRAAGGDGLAEGARPTSSGSRAQLAPRRRRGRRRIPSPAHGARDTRAAPRHGGPSERPGPGRRSRHRGPTSTKGGADQGARAPPRPRSHAAAPRPRTRPATARRRHPGAPRDRRRHSPSWAPPRGATGSTCQRDVAVGPGHTHLNRSRGAPRR